MNLEHYRQRLLAVHQETINEARASPRQRHRAKRWGPARHRRRELQRRADVPANWPRWRPLEPCSAKCETRWTASRTAPSADVRKTADRSRKLGSRPCHGLRTVTGMTGGDHQGRRDAPADRNVARPDESGCRLRHRVDILPVVPSPLLNALDEMNAQLAFHLQDTERCERHGNLPGVWVNSSRHSKPGRLPITRRAT